MNFQILSLFPDLIESYLKDGVVASAYKKNLFSLQLINPRSYALDQHKSVDDRPFGGGDGMVMMPEIMEKALAARSEKNDHVVYLSPQGTHFCEKKVNEFYQKKNITLICGRYAGLDQRFINTYVDEEISLGDFVISGGELAALCVMDAVVRKIPGSLGHVDSAIEDSFAGPDGGLESPLFTRPQVWQGHTVPEILLSGHHGRIQIWRDQIAKLATLKKRPDLSKLSDFEKKQLQKFYSQLTPDEKKVCDIEGLQF